MGNRTLLEISHDHWTRIQKDPQGFAADMCLYMGSASKRDAATLENYGVRVIAMRHNTEHYIIQGKTEGFPESYAATPLMLSTLDKIATWMERQAARDEAQAKTSERFPSLAEACVADAKNLRAMAKDAREAIRKARS